jgi:hypothetical protein
MYKAVAVMGLGLMGYSFAWRLQNEKFSARFSPRNVEGAQAALVERIIKDPKEKKARLAELREGLKEVAKAPAKDRCVFEKGFQLDTIDKYGKKPVDETSISETKDPSDACGTIAQVSQICDTKGFYMSSGLFGIGALGLYFNIRRRRRYRENP